MIALKYLLIILGIGLFGSAGALVVYDVYASSQLRRLLRRSSEETAGGASAGATSFLSSGHFGPVRWQRALQLALLAIVPLLIQKIIAERLSDKLQMMMVPVDGKNFFANDVFRSAFSGIPSAAGDDDSDGSTSAANVNVQKRTHQP
jgi:hypothetical protein